MQYFQNWELNLKMLTKLVFIKKNSIRINEPAKTDIEALEPFEREILNNF